MNVVMNTNVVISLMGKQFIFLMLPFKYSEWNIWSLVGLLKHHLLWAWGKSRRPFPTLWDINLAWTDSTKDTLQGLYKNLSLSLFLIWTLTQTWSFIVCMDQKIMKPCMDDWRATTKINIEYPSTTTTQHQEFNMVIVLKNFAWLIHYLQVFYLNFTF